MQLEDVKELAEDAKDLLEEIQTYARGILKV